MGEGAVHPDARRRLPDRRLAVSFWFDHTDIAGITHSYHATIGFYDPRNGIVGEIFLNNKKVDSLLDAFASDSATLASHLIQRGLSLTELGDMLKRNVDGSPASPLALALDIVAREFSEAAP